MAKDGQVETDRKARASASAHADAGLLIHLRRRTLAEVVALWHQVNPPLDDDDVLLGAPTSATALVDDTVALIWERFDGLPVGPARRGVLETHSQGIRLTINDGAIFTILASIDEPEDADRYAPH